MDMNSFSPMMPTSPLSMINQVKFEDEPDLKDLFITVDAPESHVTTIETFITYRIITKVTIFLNVIVLFELLKMCSVKESCVLTLLMKAILRKRIAS